MIPLVFLWLGWLDSNQRIWESKPHVLPLDYTPRETGHCGLRRDARLVKRIMR